MAANIIIIAIVIGIIAAITTYLIRAKRRGETCVGCPYAKGCGSQQCSSNQCTSSDNNVTSFENSH